MRNRNGENSDELDALRNIDGLEEISQFDDSDFDNDEFNDELDTDFIDIDSKEI